MADTQSVNPPKIGLFLFWLLLIVFGGSIVLVTTSLRIGQQNANVTNKKFAFKVLAPYHFALTTVLSVIFLLPIYRGVSLIIFLFMIFLSIMVPIGKSDFSKWPIFAGKDKR